MLVHDVSAELPRLQCLDVENVPAVGDGLAAIIGGTAVVFLWFWFRVMSFWFLF